VDASKDCNDVVHMTFVKIVSNYIILTFLLLTANYNIPETLATQTQTTSEHSVTIKTKRVECIGQIEMEEWRALVQ